MKQAGRRFGTPARGAGILLAVPLLYLPSPGPVLLAGTWLLVGSRYEAAFQAGVHVVYAPVNWLGDKSETVARFSSRYWELCYRLL